MFELVFIMFPLIPIEDPYSPNGQADIIDPLTSCTLSAIYCMAKLAKECQATERSRQNKLPFLPTSNSSSLIKGGSYTG